MARDVSTQPMIKDANDLAIGLMQVRPGEINYDTEVLLDGGASIDATTAPVPLNAASASIGALQSAGMKASPTYKTHTAGYPKTVDVNMVETTAVEYNLQVEEFLSGKGFTLLQNILDTLNTGTIHYYAIDAISQFANGPTLEFYTPIATLKPDLSLSITNDWGALPITFEAVYKDSLTNSELVYWNIDDGVTSRSDDYQPITLDPDDLVIGKMQFRLGAFATRTSGSAAAVYPVRKVVGAQNSIFVSNATGTYAGTVDGAFVITITTGGAGTSAKYTLTHPDGTVDSETAVVIGSVTLGDGISVDFANDTYVLNDVYVVGVKAGGAMAGSKTNVASPYPYLPSASSIGAVSSTDISSDITYKDHMSGYPEKKTLSILESVGLKATAAVEEMSFSARPSVNGEAVNLADAIMDSASSGALYYAPLEVIATTVSGKILSLWFPNAQLVPDAEFAPGDDWANLSISFSALSTGITGLNMAYAYVIG